MKRQNMAVSMRGLTALLLVGFLLLNGVAVFPIQPAYAAGTYGKATVNGVNVRKQPATKAAVWFQIDQGYVCPVLDTTTVGGKAWYKVKVDHPDPKNTRQYTGYISADYFALLSNEEAASWEANPVQPNGGVAATAPPAAQTTATASPSYTLPPVNSGAIGEITNGEVNFRQEAAKYGKVLMKLNRGTQVEILSAPTVIDAEHFFQIRYAGFTGFVQAPFVRVISSGSGNSIVATPTISAPETAPTPPPAVQAYVKLLKSSANLRLSPGGKVGARWEKQGETLPVSGASVKKGGYTWYPVTFNGNAYFVREDTVELVSTQVTPQVSAVPTAVPGGGVTLPPAASQPPVVTPVPSVTLPPSVFGYARLVLSSANLRTSPGGPVGRQWETMGEVIPVIAAFIEKSGVKWYPVDYHGSHYYVSEETVQIISTPDATMVPGQPGVPATTVPTATPVAAAPQYGYVKTTKKVKLRLQPSGAVVQQVAANTVLPVISPMLSQGGYGWYHVQVDQVRGYLRGDFVVISQADGSPVVPELTTNPIVSPTPVPNQEYIKLIDDRINLRNKPNGSSIEQLAIGVVLPVTGTPQQAGRYTWYPVISPSGKKGVVRGDFVAVSDASGNSIVATPVPGAPTTPSPMGYFMITTAKVNLRKTPGGTSDGVAQKDSVLPITGSSVNKGRYTWYPVQQGQKTVYIRGDMGYKLSSEQEANYLAGQPIPLPSATPAPVHYVQTIIDKVHLRTSPSKDAAAPYNIAQGTVLAYSTIQPSGGSRWYKVVYNNTELWILGSTVKVMTAAEYEQYLASTPQVTPQPEVILGYVRTSKGGVNIRNKANGGTIIERISVEGAVMPFSKTPETVKKYAWYYVKSPGGKYGYVRSDFITLVQEDGSPLATPTPNPQATPSGGGAEASYKTLKLGSSGTNVRKLVAELKAQGYYFGEITNSFTSAVEAAVKTFQIAKQINPDGVAGADTQHALFGTVPEGSTGQQTGGMTIYAAEKVDWYTGDIQQLWPKGTNHKIYDVQTGLIWTAHRWSGGKHVDAEPLTSADTAVLCKIYGVSNAREIASKNMWQRRPSLVTIGNRTFACSIYGVPHNYPAGDTIANNNYNGQLCIHFSNSRTHTSNKVDSYHTKAIQYAWENAPNGHK